MIEGLLCDASGSSCCLFVGSYRSNEVKEDHTIFRICNDLRAKDVPVTTLTLEGLGPAHLNSMISDALGTFPRVCEPLSDILFQKTKGNPFFVLEFMQMLEEERLLEYNTEERRWIWDEDRISTMDVAGNVLHILSSKMNGLPESTQSVLKTSACFGVIKEPVIRYLSTNIEYSDMRNGLKHAVAEGFMIKVGSSGYKFAHDKVRISVHVTWQSLIAISLMNSIFLLSLEPCESWEGTRGSIWPDTRQREEPGKYHVMMIDSHVRLMNLGGCSTSAQCSDFRS